MDVPQRSLRKRRQVNYADCDDEWSGEGEEIQPRIRKPSAQKRKKTTKMRSEKPGSSKKSKQTTTSTAQQKPNKNETSSKRVKGIALPEAKPIAKRDHKTSSQETVITDVCLCLVPHIASDCHSSSGMFGNTPCVTSHATPSSMCQKTASLQPQKARLKAGPPQNGKNKQLPIASPKLASNEPTKNVMPPVTSFVGRAAAAAASKKMTPASALRLGLSRKRPLRQPLHPKNPVEVKR